MNWKSGNLGFTLLSSLWPFQPFRVPSVSSQGPVCKALTILSFYFIFKNPLRAYNIRELRQLGAIVSTTVQATRPAVGSLFLKKKNIPGCSICQQSCWPLTVNIRLFPCEDVPGIWLRDWLQRKVFLQFQSATLALQGVCTNFHSCGSKAKSLKSVGCPRRSIIS